MVWNTWPKQSHILSFGLDVLRWKKYFPLGTASGTFGGSQIPLWEPQIELTRRIISMFGLFWGKKTGIVWVWVWVIRTSLKLTPMISVTEINIVGQLLLCNSCIKERQTDRQKESVGAVVRRCDVFCFTLQREHLDHSCIPSPCSNLIVAVPL